MINARKQSFIERLTGTVNVEADDFEGTSSGDARPVRAYAHQIPENISQEEEYMDEGVEEEVVEESEPDDEEGDDGQLAVDIYETDNEIIIQSMIAGVTPENLNVSITRETVTIRGKRVAPEGIALDQYVTKELFWGVFSREITLPTEIDTEGAEAVEKYGLLIIRLPKLDTHRTQKLVVKSI